MASMFVRHSVFLVYLVSLGWLAAAVLMFSLSAGKTTTGVWAVICFAASVAMVYAAFMGLVNRCWPSLTRSRAADSTDDLLDPTRRRWLGLFVLFYGVIVASHFLIIGYIPILAALRSSSDIGVSLVRQAGYFDLSPLMRYASDYCLKGVGPALLLITYYLRSRLFWVVLLIGGFYSMALFARMLPMILLVPLLVYMLLSRRWFQAAAVVCLLALMVGALTSVASIAIREELRVTATEAIVLSDETRSVGKGYQALPAKPPKAEQDWRRTSALYATYERALIVPGQVIDQWFYYYDRPDRREHGCGYRLLARVIGCEYVHIPTKLYAVFYQDNIAQGMKGSLNAASFMTDYANWGFVGLAVSVFMSGLLFALVALIYRDHPLALSMNLPLIVVAMESNLMTAVNSGGGWLVMTLFFILFFRLNKQ